MRTVSRITTKYDSREDRLRLTAMDGERRAIQLWLTQRLTGRVIARLLARLESKATEGVGKTAGAATKEAAQLWEQTNAELRQRPARPVTPPADVEDHLVEAVRIRHRDDSVVLVFRWNVKAASEETDEADTSAIALQIDDIRLRQWLRIFHGHYRSAGWPLDSWPRWFSGEATAQVLGNKNLH